MTEDRQGYDKRKLCIALLLSGLVALLGRHALVLLAHLASSNSEYSHIMLVVPIALAFLLFERRPGSADRPLPRAAGFVCGGAAVALALLSTMSPESLKLSVQVSAIVLAVWAIAILIYGPSFSRSSVFPMLVLVLLIPWPTAVVERLTTLLQAGSTTAAYWLFRTFGIPVTRQGFVLSLPSVDIEVAEECSGIRSTVMLGLTALVLGQWYLRSGWRKLFLILAVLPIGVLRNGLRIFILSVLGTYVNESWLDGNLHHRGGIVFFILGLVLLAILIWMLRVPERGLRKQPAV